MRFAIITEYPLWFILFCLLTGAAYAFALYYREHRYEFSKKIKYILAATRFVLISLIVFLLLSPLIKSSVKEYEHPLLILAHDNSRSIILNQDSNYYKTTYVQEVKELYNTLDETYETLHYTFGDSLQTSDKLLFNEQTTDISSVFQDLYYRMENRNVGAMLLFTDGIYNRGQNPTQLAKNFAFPIYTIALGDTNLRKDAWILKTAYNSYAYKGNTFPIEAIINANKCNGDQLEIKLIQGNNTIAQKKITATKEIFSTTINFDLQANTTGIQHYQLIITALDDELNTQNNVEDIYIEVIEDKQKIAIIYNAPHPDIAAIASALESNINYEVKKYSIDDFNGDISKYNLIILHQLPSKRKRINTIIEQARLTQQPILFVLGTQSDILQFNAYKQGLQIIPRSSDRNDAYAAYKHDFNLFSLSSYTSQLIEQLPPLSVVYGEYRTAMSFNPLFAQKIGNVKTSMPLIAVNDDPAMPRAYILGDGIWRWKLSNYKKARNHDAFNELINKLAQYLSIRESRKRFNVIVPDEAVEGESVIFTAELYDKTYEPIPDADIKLRLIDEQDNEYDYSFLPTQDFYTLNLGMLKQGQYRYTAVADNAGEKLYDKGQCIVYNRDLEANILRADHQLLQRIAVQSNAKMYYPHTMQKIIDELEAIPNTKPITYFKEDYKDMIDWPIILIILLLLASLEWFFRKYKGGY